MQNSGDELAALVATLDPQRRALLDRRRRQLRAALRRDRPGRRPAGAPAPLSDAQQRLWFLHRLDPSRLDYNVAAGFDLRGPLDVAALSAAIERTLTQHGILRSVVDDSGPEPLLSATAAPRLVIQDAPGHAAVDGAAADVVAELALTPFDLRRGPLVRAGLVRLGPQHHQLVLAAHHLVCDGWSIELVIKQIAARYRGGEPAWAALDYGDYAYWQRNSSSFVEQRLEQRVAELTPPAERLDFGRESAPGAPLPGFAVDFDVQLGDAARVSSSTVAGAAPETVVCLAAWAYVLSKRTNRDRFSIAAPVANRPHPELEEVIGLFANTVVVPVDARGEPAFAELVARIAGAARQAFDRSEVPFDRLARRLDPDFAHGSTPLVSVGFSPASFRYSLELPGLVCTPVALPVRHVPIELSLVVRGRDAGGTLRAALLVGDGVLTPGHARELASDVAEVVRTGAIGRTVSAAPASDAEPVTTNLSRTQMAMWLGQQLYPGVPLYDEVLVATIDAELDPDQFSMAWRSVASRIDALRLRVAAHDGVPVQHTDAVVPDLEHADLPADLSLDDWLARRRQRTIDLSANATSAVLVRLGARRWAFCVTAHHIATDARSMWLVLERVLQAYADGRAGAAAELGILDQVAAERVWLASARGRAAIAHWDAQAALPAAPVTFYGNRLGTTTQVHRVSSTLQANEIDAIQCAHLGLGLSAFSRDQAVLVMLCAATAAWVHRATARSRVRIGVAFHNRGTRAQRQAIGPLMSICPVDVTVSPTDTFRELAAQVDGAIAAVLPFARASVANRPRERAYDVVVNLHVGDRTALPGPAVTRVCLGNSGHDYDGVTVHAQSDDDLASLDLTLDLDGVAFDGREQTAYAHLRRLLDAAAGPAQTGPVASIRVLTELEQDQLAALRHGSPTGRLPVLRWDRPDAVALTAGRTAVTWSGLAVHVAHVAAKLAAAGVADGEAVAVLTGRTMSAVSAVLGAWRHGATPVPLDPAWPSAHSEAVIAASGARVGLVAPPLVPPGSLEWIDLGRRDDHSGGHGDGRHGGSYSGRAGAARRAHPERLAALMRTSGTSGEPKLVALTQRGVWGYAQWAAGRFELTPADRVRQFASPGFDTWFEEVLPALLAGATVVFGDGDGIEPPGRFMARAAREQCTVVDLPTAYWALMLRETPAPFARAPAARLCVIGGERVSPPTVGRWRTATGAQVRLLDTYGPTEATVVATCADLGADGSPPRIGRPVGPAGVEVLGESLVAVPPGVVGELALGGAGIARGYHGQAAATADRFRPAPGGPRRYLTGDAGRLHADGELSFEGRLDRQLKVRGQRVEPAEVESVLAAAPGVDAAAVWGEDAPEGLHLVAVVSGPDVDPSAVRRFLRTRLPDAALPSRLGVATSLPLTPNGKVDRELARAPLATTGTEPGEVASTPATHTERALAETWAHLLRAPAGTIGRDSSFFDLGGHSLLAMMLATRVERTFGIELGLRAVFEHPVLRDLAEEIDSAAPTAGPARPPVTRQPLCPSGLAPASSVQRQLWLLDQVDGGAARWNVPAAVRATGPLDVTALRKAVAAVIERHEILRTTLEEHDGIVYQRVHATLEVAVPIAEIGSDAELSALAAELTAQPFDLALGPPFRIIVVRRPGMHDVVLLCMHHTCVDGWSVGVLLSDLAAWYDAVKSGDPPVLPPLPVQYTDFAEWQRSWARTDLYREHLDWWRTYLVGAPAVLDVAPGRPRTAPPDRAGVSRRVAFGGEVVATVGRTARELGVTVNAVLLAAWAALISRRTGRTDLVIGTPASGRADPATDRLIGAFMNSLPVRIDLSRAATFADLADHVQQQLLDVLARQDVPFDAIVQAVAPPRTPLHDPLFQVMFTYLNEPTRSELHADDLYFEPLDLVRGQANRDLTLRLVDEDLTGHLEAAADRFDAGDLAEWADGLQSLVAAAAGSPRTPLAELPVTAAPPAPLPGGSSGASARSRFAAAARPVVAGTLAEADGDFPRRYVCRTRDIDAPAWARAHRDEILRDLAAHGATLFRGFGVTEPDQLAAVAEAVSGALTGYSEASTPRTHIGERIYTSTEYPADQSIMLHNEMAYAHSWPRHVWFACRVAADEGGATPIARCTSVLKALAPDVVDEFRRRGVRYLRTYSPRLDLPWQQVFATADRDEVMRRCAEWGLDCIWPSEDELRTISRRCAATVTLPGSGQEAWFNSAHMFHVAALPADVATALRSMAADDELPRHAQFGDGGTIPDETIAHVRDTYAKLAVRFGWRRGDALLINNLAVAHGRDPYAGAREIIVAMAG